MLNDRTRREFMRDSLTTAAIAGGGAVCLCGLSGCAGNTPLVDERFVKRSDGEIVLDVAKIPELASPGGSARLAAGKHSIIVIHADENRFHALSNKCTHFGRPVDYDPAQKRLVCASFGHSAFDLGGAVLKGPAKKPLATYITSLMDGQLTISV